MNKFIKVFENIEAIHITASMLKQPQQKAIGILETLRYLHLFDSNFLFITKDLFEPNTEMKHIIMHRNKINFVHSNDFDYLHKLTVLKKFDGNVCISRTKTQINSTYKVFNDAKENCTNLKANFMEKS